MELNQRKNLKPKDRYKLLMTSRNEEGIISAYEYLKEIYPKDDINLDLHQLDITNNKSINDFLN